LLIRHTGTGTVLVACLVLSSSALSSSAGAAETPTIDYWGNSQHAHTPQVADVPGTVVQVATIDNTWYALTSAGTVWAWGNNQHGQFGTGSTGSDSLTPQQVDFPAGVRIAFLANTAPNWTALAVDTKGKAWGWGRDGDGQLCQGGRVEYDTPVLLPLTHVTAIAGAGDHSLIVSDGKLYACGANGAGDLGVGSTEKSYSPVAVPLSGVTSVYASWEGSAALVGGTLYEWGYNRYGDVGNGTTTNALAPQVVHLPLAVTQVALGGGQSYDGQTLVLLSDGSLWAWGADQYGQLGDGGSGYVTSPEEISAPAAYVQIESAGRTSFGIDADGNLWGWGYNGHYDLGNGTTVNDPTPAVIVSNATALSATANTEEALVKS
jgi:alpha-tubulin suppressor-like RCC1 family protein